MNEHEAMGKLVKEIADVLNQWRKCGRLERTPDIPLSIYKKDCPDILEITEGESAKSLISLILSAVRDGLSFELIEEIAALEHEQWMEWSKHVADEVSPERRARWEAYWVPYEELSEEVKEHDRVWARKIITLSGTGKKEE